MKEYIVQPVFLTGSCYFVNLNFPGLFQSPWVKQLSPHKERTLNSSPHIEPREELIASSYLLLMAGSPLSE